MSVFERIKGLFKRIGNKQKLLESPEEMGDGMPDTPSPNKRDSQFFRDIKVDPTDLLDPRVCQGDNLVPNILRTLGASTEVIKNPRAMQAIKRQVTNIATQSGLKMPSSSEQPTREQIEAIVGAVKSNMVLSSDAREAEYAQAMFSTDKSYHGLSIDKETGSVTIGSFDIVHKRSFSHDMYSESTFVPDGRGNVLATDSYSIIESGHERLDTDKREVLNGDGIVMESETRRYGQINGENSVKYHTKAKRDPEYPFIAQEEVLVDDRVPNGERARYAVISKKDLSQLTALEYQKDESGIETFTPIAFDDRSKISEYYQENKEDIDGALMQRPDIRKLAEKAGILPNEHETERD